MSAGTKTQNPPRRFPWWIYWTSLALILVLALAPMISVLVAFWLAEVHGCILNEASTHPCIINGADWGSDLYFMLVMGWFMLATIPLGGIAIAVWLAVLLIHRYLVWHRSWRFEA